MCRFDLDLHTVFIDTHPNLFLISGSALYLADSEKREGPHRRHTVPVDVLMIQQLPKVRKIGIDQKALTTWNSYNDLSYYSVGSIIIANFLSWAKN